MSNKIVESERYECDHSSQAVPYILMEFREFCRSRQEIWKEEQRKKPFRVGDVDAPTVHKESCRF